MATHDESVDISTTNPYPLGKVRVMCHGTDITMHVPSTGIHLSRNQARDLLLILGQAMDCADSNASNVGL